MPNFISELVAGARFILAFLPEFLGFLDLQKDRESSLRAEEETVSMEALARAPSPYTWLWKACWAHTQVTLVCLDSLDVSHPEVASHPQISGRGSKVADQRPEHQSLFKAKFEKALIVLTQLYLL